MVRAQPGVAARSEDAGLIDGTDEIGGNSQPTKAAVKQAKSQRDPAMGRGRQMSCSMSASQSWAYRASQRISSASAVLMGLSRRAGDPTRSRMHRTRAAP